MTVRLKKGQGVSLKKKENNLSMVTIGLGWDVQEEQQGAFSLEERLPDYDLDVAAFLCGSDGKVHRFGTRNGRRTLIDGDVVFYNYLRHASGQIWLTGDNRTGSEDGDDEQIIVKLNDLPGEYHKIVFVISIYEGIKRNQSFENVKNAYIRAVDGNGREMIRFDLSGGTAYVNCRSMLFAELVREGNGWNFNAIGTPSQSDTFVTFLKQYLG